MSSLKDLALEKIHTREISVATFLAGEDRIVVEGSLLDTRLRDYYLFTGEKKPSGVLHHLIIRLLLEGPALLIRDLEVEMPGIPREGCIELKGSLSPVIGLSISSGFTGKVKTLVGGIKGCFHLMSLLLAMAPAAVQGYWSCRALKPMPKNAIPAADRIKMMPVNSCRVWSEDGPLMQRIREELGCS